MIKGLLNFINLKQDDILLDPFMGSGTSLIVAKILGLKSIGLDINPFCCFLTSMKCDCFNLNIKDIENCYKFSFEQLTEMVKDKGFNFKNYDFFEVDSVLNQKTGL